MSEALSRHELSNLDTNGFLVLSEVVPAEDLQVLRARVQGQGKNEPRGEDLQDEALARALAHSAVQAAVAHILGSQSVVVRRGWRAPPPGRGAQVLHTDWHVPVAEGDYHCCNVLFPLVAFTARNGATRVVPGSHRCGKLPRFRDPRQHHPGEQRVLAPVGAAIVLNSHVWHSGMLNESSAPRTALIAGFRRG